MVSVFRNLRVGAYFLLPKTLKKVQESRRQCMKWNLTHPQVISTNSISTSFWVGYISGFPSTYCIFWAEIFQCPRLPCWIACSGWSWWFLKYPQALWLINGGRNTASSSRAYSLLVDWPSSGWQKHMCSCYWPISCGLWVLPSNQGLCLLFFTIL